MNVLGRLKSLVLAIGLFVSMLTSVLAPGIAAAGTTTLTPAFDTQVNASRPTSYYPNSAVIYTQKDAYLGFFRFDASALLASGQSITSVTFEPYINYTTTSDGVLQIFSIDSNWGTQTTWSSSSTQRAECTGTPLASLAVPSGGTRVSLSLPTSVVSPDGSVNICAANTSSAGQIRIASMDDTRSPANPPHLIVSTDVAANDTTPPSTPANLSATAGSASSVGLAWTASSDNVAVANYEVFRDGSNVGTTTTPSFTDTTVSAAITYSYAVRAVDTSGNMSALSTSATITTPAQPASASTIFTVDDLALTDISSWAVSRANDGIRWTNQDRTNQAAQMYAIGPNGQTVATANLTGPGVTHIDPEAAATAVINGTPYVYESDAGGNLDRRDPIYVHRFVEPSLDVNNPGQSLNVTADTWTLNYPSQDLNTARTIGPDSESLLVNPQTGQMYIIVKNNSGLPTGTTSWGIYAAPLAAANTPGTYNLTRIASTSLVTTDAAWSADGSEIALRTYDNVYLYKVQQGDVAAALSTTPYVITPPSMQQSEGISFSADGQAVELSTEEHNGQHAPVVRQPLPANYTVAPITLVSPGSSDTTPPSVPTNLAGTASPTSVSLSWTASTDNVAVASYEVLRDSYLIGTTNTTNYTDSTVSPSTTYSYTVRAIDTSANVSGTATAVQVTTPAQATPTSIQAISLDTGTVNSGTSFTTNSVDTQYNTTLFLYVTAGRTDGTATYPQSVSGLGADWQLVTSETVGSGNLKSAVYKGTNASGTGAVTVTYPGTQQNFSWQLVQAGSSTISVTQTATFSGAGTSPSASFSQPVTSTDAVLGFIASNSTSQTITPTADSLELAPVVTNSVPSVRTYGAWRTNSTNQQLAFTTSGSNQKTILGLVLRDGSTGGGTTGSTAKVAVIGDSLTYQDGAGVANISALFAQNGYAASNLYVYGVGGKKMTAADSAGKTTLQNITDARAQLGSVDVWVIALGTNDVNETDQEYINNMQAILSAIGPTDKVVWIGMAFYGVANTNAAHFNPIEASTLGSYSNAVWADWNSYIHNGRDETGLWVYPVDYTHMTAAGYEIRNQYYLDQINGVLN